jgi:hypothetical protein
MELSDYWESDISSVIQEIPPICLYKEPDDSIQLRSILWCKDPF